MVPPADAARPAMRVHAFALISGIGWLVDFAIFNLLALVGTPMFLANLVGAGVAVSLVFVAGRRFIFKDSRTALPVAIAAYIVWNVVAILVASAAVALIGRLLANPAVLERVDMGFAALGLPLRPVYLVPPVAKIAVTPFTMYFNYVAMGMIIERRLRFW